MESGTATKVVAGFALGGAGLALWLGQGGADRYRKVWGVVLLSAAGAALADFAPSMVGWFFALVIIAYAVSHQSQISSAVSGVRSTATGTQPKPKGTK